MPVPKIAYLEVVLARGIGVVAFHYVRFWLHSRLHDLRGYADFSRPSEDTLP
jgi:hypothetical protein